MALASSRQFESVLRELYSPILGEISIENTYSTDYLVLGPTIYCTTSTDFSAKFSDVAELGRALMTVPTSKRIKYDKDHVIVEFVATSEITAHWAVHNKLRDRQSSRVTVQSLAALGILVDIKYDRKGKGERPIPQDCSFEALDEIGTIIYHLKKSLFLDGYQLHEILGNLIDHLPESPYTGRYVRGSDELNSRCQLAVAAIKNDSISVWGKIWKQSVLMGFPKGLTDLPFHVESIYLNETQALRRTLSPIVVSQKKNFKRAPVVVLIPVANKFSVMDIKDAKEHLVDRGCIFLKDVGLRLVKAPGQIFEDFGFINQLFWNKRWLRC